MKKKRYKKNFLDKVVLKIEFSPILKIRKEPIDFQDYIRKDFPYFSENQVTARRIEYNEEIETFRKPLWIFKNKNKNTLILLTDNSIEIDCRNWCSYERFKETLQNIFNSFRSCYQPVDVISLSLRYVNDIHVNNIINYDFSNYINSDLTRMIDNFIENKNEINRVLTQTLLNKDDYIIFFNHGILNDAHYLLDYECRTSKEVAEIEVLDIFGHFNEEINQLFEKSICDGLRKIMEAENE
ncbi:MAG: TIGR04255 family protein [Pseudomonadota bacterium]|nr:TIGR04255 family protein [Pseudomonadota bacterium]